MSEKTRKYAKELVSQMTLEEKMSQMLYESPAIERLGIPAYTGGMKRCTEWQEQVWQLYFRRRLGLRQHFIRSFCIRLQMRYQQKAGQSSMNFPNVEIMESIKDLPSGRPM